MSERRARYQLRIQLLPGPDLPERAAELVTFRREHAIDEAVLFVAAEEWNDGLIDDQQLEAWYAALALAKQTLEAEGITVSLNPWYTVLHTDRGRHMPSGYSFTPMVSPGGRKARAVASFACPNWLAYIRHIYGRLAELGFRVIWIEDDFRYHNHEPLDWGGDFSEAMLGRFAAKIGRPVSREEVVSAILRSGEPHPWRALWLETWREAQLSAVSAIRQSVLAASPDTLLGLMSSHPTSHSIEGRDWDRLFTAMNNGGKVVHRPHFTTYQDSSGVHLARSSFLLDYQKQLRPASLSFEVAPEIENFPMHPFSKSQTVTWGQMALAQVHGSDALHLDLFSFTCSRLADEPWVGPLLDRCKPGLDRLAELFPPALQSSGVGVLWRPDASLHVRTTHGQEMAELSVPLTGAAELLQALGIAVQARAGDVNCLWGPVAWAYSDAELRQLLSGGLWLDAVATAILQQRGFAAYLPAEHGFWWARDDINYSMEHPESTATGLEPRLWLSVNGFTRVAYQSPAPGAREWTSLRDAGGKRIGAGITVCENALGGRVATCPWPLAEEPQAYVLSLHRQKLVQQLIAALCSGKSALPASASGCPYTFPLDMRQGEVRRVALFNASLDAQSPVLQVPGAKAVGSAWLLAPLQPPRRLAATAEVDGAGLRLTAAEPLPFCALAVYELS